MIESLDNGKRRRNCIRISHLLFILWLVTEVVYEHTAVSRICLFAYVAFVIFSWIREKQFRFSVWMLLYGIFALFAAVASVFAVHQGPSWKKVITILLNGFFLIQYYQYVLMDPEPERISNAFLIGAACCVILIGILCYPLDFNIRRFGQIRDAEDPMLMINIVNPNLIGTIAAFAFAILFSRILNQKAGKQTILWVLAAAFFIAVILMTKSLKAYAATLFLAIAVLLIRFPKLWPVKLAVLVLGAMVVYFKVIPLFPRFNQTFFYNMRATLSYILYRDTTKMSINARTELAAVGIHAIRQHPLLGIGLDGFRFLEGADETYSHNNYIELLVSGGIPLALAYYSVYFYAVYRAVRNRKKIGPAAHALLLITAVQLFLDIGMVSYVDRTTLMWPVWLLGEVRRNSGEKDNGRTGYGILANPCVLVRYASNKSMLRWMPDRLYLKLLYRGIMNCRLHLDPPEKMTEKQQWMKLYDRNPAYPKLADKIEARRFVKERIGEQYLIPVLGTWDSVSKIDFSALPERFVLKCTHDSGSAVVCADRKSFDISRAKEKLEKHMATNYYWSGREWPYKDLKHFVMAEAFISDQDGGLPPDYKLFCFNGVPKALLLCANRTEKHADYYFFDMDMNPLPINEDTVRDREKLKYKKPENFEDMLRVAGILSEGIPFVRVDLYNVDGKVYFGELTLFDQSGFAADYVGDGDLYMGSFLQLGGKQG